MVGVIDYDAGNVKSVMKAVNKLGAEAVLTSDPKILDTCSSLILPGVGSFGKAMDHLEERNLDTYIKKAVKEGRLFLGICLGLQMLFDRSFEEGEHAGLRLIPGDVVRFGKESDPEWDETLKIPHMGWNELVQNRTDRIGEGIAKGEYAYFVHSYYARPADWNDVVYYADYSVRVPGVVRKDNVIGMQFHPEKSSETGMKLLKNFLKEGEHIAG